jgi:hypothetical protein
VFSYDSQGKFGNFIARVKKSSKVLFMIRVLDVSMVEQVLLKKNVYYSDRNHDIVLFDYFLLSLTGWLSDISQKAYYK